MITIKGKMIDIDFDHINTGSNASYQFVMTLPAESVITLLNEIDGRREIRIVGDREAKDFLHACSFIWEDFLTEKIDQ